MYIMLVYKFVCIASALICMYACMLGVYAGVGRGVFCWGAFFSSYILIINHAFSACTLSTLSQRSEASHFLSVIDIVPVSISIAFILHEVNGWLAGWMDECRHLLCNLLHLCSVLPLQK